MALEPIFREFESLPEYNAFMVDVGIHDRLKLCFSRVRVLLLAQKYTESEAATLEWRLVLKTRGI